jgi:hypothetical protein
MKNLICLSIALPLYFLTSCEKGYKDEIFIDKYQVIYGTWEFQFTVLDSGFKNEPKHIIEFIPYGQFRYNGGKSGKIKITLQNQTDLCIDFNSLFPDREYGFIYFAGSDSMDIVTNNHASLYLRK